MGSIEVLLVMSQYRICVIELEYATQVKPLGTFHLFDKP